VRHKLTPVDFERGLVEIVVAVAVEGDQRCEDAYNQPCGIVDTVKGFRIGFEIKPAKGFDKIRCAERLELGFGDFFKPGGDLGEILIALLILKHNRRVTERWNIGIKE
jgi:hypothetical protein